MYQVMINLSAGRPTCLVHDMCSYKVRFSYDMAFQVCFCLYKFSISENSRKALEEDLFDFIYY